MEENRCHLCGQDAPLLNSHVVPAFVFKWLKKTSATGFLRQRENSNLRVQDGPKAPLLCSACEQRIGDTESAFRKYAFEAIVAGGPVSIRYESWLLRFAISLAWRCVKHHQMQHDYRHSNPVIQTQLDEAMETWRRFLLGETDSPGRWKHHVFLLDTVEDGPGTGKDLTDFDWYNLRSVDMTLPESKTVLATYVKLPCIAFWGCIVPPSPSGWTGTQVNLRGTLKAPQTIKNEQFGEFYPGRVRQVMSERPPLSDRQQAKIDEAVLRDPERTLASDSARVLRADARRRGLEPQEEV